MTAANAKYTPGPWYADEDGRIREEATDYIIARTDDGGHVSGRRMISETAEADNARLIAAAPDLVEACRYIVEAGENGDEVTAIAKARAALSKAGV